MPKFILLTESGKFEEHQGKLAKGRVTIQVEGRAIHGSSTRVAGIYELDSPYSEHDYLPSKGGDCTDIGHKTYRRFVHLAGAHTAKDWQELSRAAGPFISIWEYFQEWTFEQIFEALPQMLRYGLSRAEQVVQNHEKSLAQARKDLAWTTKKGKALSKYLAEKNPPVELPVNSNT